MRVPACATLVLLAVCVSCGQSRDADLEPDRPSARACNRAELPDSLDPRAFSWSLRLPPGGDNARGVPWQVDQLIDACESIVSLAHDVGPGGKTMVYGGSHVFVTTTGTTWSSAVLEGVDGATFFDIARGDGVWVAVGRLETGDGVIAVADSPDSQAWRRVFSTKEWPFRHVAFGAGRFVAQSRFGLAVSSDAEHWSWIPAASGAQYEDVAFGNGRFVVAGLGTTISSADGKTWQRMACRDRAACPPPAPDSPMLDALTDPIALQQVTFVGGKFYAYGGSGALESADGLTFSRVRVNIPDAAIGGALIGMASDADMHWAYTQRLSDPPRVFASIDDGQTWFDLPLTVSSDPVDCSQEMCVVVPQGILVMQEKPKSPPPSALCDGTHDIRLMYQTGPGFVPDTYSFVAPYGNFFAIDGTCHFYAQDNPAHAIVQGVLTAEQAAQLSSDVAWNQLPVWGNYRSDVQCPDAGGVALGALHVSLSCGPAEASACGCGDSAPAGLSAALQNARRWHAMLVENGSPVTGAMSAVARAGNTSAAGQPQPWPLARSMRTIPGLIVDPNRGQSTSGSVRFEDPMDTLLLRQLRDRQPDAAYTGWYAFNVLEEGTTYSLYLRDELPDVVVDAIRVLMQTWVFE